MGKAQQPPQDDFSLKDSLNLVMLAAQTHAACITPFLRHSFGRDQPGIFAAFGLLAMLLYAENQRDPAMFLYVAIWLAALAFHGVRALWLAWRGRVEHSFYPGYPYLTLAIPFVTRETTARALEPLFCLLAGRILFECSVPLGQFVAAGAISLSVSELAGRRLRSRRLVSMRNAEIEMRHMTDAYRRGGF